jgi:hypothetical protein
MKQDRCEHCARDLCEQHVGSRDTVHVMACGLWTAETGAILRSLRSVFTQLPDPRALPRARRWCVSLDLPRFAENNQACRSHLKCFANAVE